MFRECEILIKMEVKRKLARKKLNFCQRKADIINQNTKVKKERKKEETYIISIFKENNKYYPSF